MALSNWAFAVTFVTAIVGCLLVLLIVWYRRPKQDGYNSFGSPAAPSNVRFRGESGHAVLQRKCPLMTLNGSRSISCCAA